jgi:hypothetical protein
MNGHTGQMLIGHDKSSQSGILPADLVVTGEPGCGHQHAHRPRAFMLGRFRREYPHSAAGGRMASCDVTNRAAQVRSRQAPLHIHESKCLH